jgi:cysteine desulfurase
MSAMNIYLDYAATTPVDPRVAEVMAVYNTDKFGNPSSPHGFGQEALEAVEYGRKTLASFLNAKPNEIVFTGGGSESDNMAIKGTCETRWDKGGHLITTAIEHHAVLHTCEFMAKRGFDLTVLPVGSDGIVDPDDVKKAIRRDTILITVMHANNEVGTIQPIKEIGHIAQEASIPFHTDSVQTFGHLPIDVQEMNIDMLALSAHKLYGPKGIGIFFIKEGTPFIPLIHGGAQEAGRRSSTLNVPGIVGLAEAARLAHTSLESEHKTIAKLRDRLLNFLLSEIKQVHLNGHRTRRLANNINVSIDYVEGESLLASLDMEGISASSGSACSSGSDEPSHVLTALGLTTEEARGSLRISLGRFTTEQDIVRVESVLPEIVTRLRDLTPFGRNA